MTENKRYYCDFSGDNGTIIRDRIIDGELGEVFEFGVSDANDLCDLLNDIEERIQELETKLNQTALELLNYEMITMGKAVEISEMSYIDFLKYRKENGNPMELQL